MPPWRLLLRSLSALIAGVVLMSVAVTSSPSPASAIPRGEQVAFPGGLVISNFVMPNGSRAYCVEVSMGEPSGSASQAGRLSYLLGREGGFPAFTETSGIRQMNYLIDRHGHTGDAWTAAAVQLTIWRMRERFQAGNATLDRIIGVLQSSGLGRDAIAASDRLYAEARQAAVAPSKPRPITGALAIEQTGAEGKERFRLKYPRGTTSVSVEGGTFESSGKATATISDGKSGTLRIIPSASPTKLRASGSWLTRGSRGWDALLDVYNTSTASGSVGQRVAVATGSSVRSDLTGRFAAVAHDVPPPLAPPTAASRAQASATVGGFMHDELIVRQQAETRLSMWPEARAGFTAYLEPVAGEPKYDRSWNPTLGEAYEAQAEDPDTGQPLWREWWADAEGAALRDAHGEVISTRDDAGNPTSGVAANGTVYPLQAIGADGTPKVNADGTPLWSQGREPVMEERRDPQRWTAAELAALSSVQRCVAQPVFEVSGIPVKQPGVVESGTVEVRSAGTIHWVERVVSRGEVVHEGRCGVPNETTRIDQPAIETQALPSAVLGAAIFDVATVSGTLAEGAQYSVRFEAYRAPESGRHDGSAATPEPACTAENIVFRSPFIPITEVGEVRSPEITASLAHGTRVWWVETLVLETPSGPQVLHRGACGVENETTDIGRPKVETEAVETAPIGAAISDTAQITGELAENDAAQWEVTFSGYRASDAVRPAAGELLQASPATESGAVCTEDNLLFETAAVPVRGPGEVQSPEVIAEPEWAGSVWWVETLWLLQAGERTAVHTGTCGLDTETTIVTTPDVETDATAIVVVGDDMTDTARISGELTDRSGVEHRLVFRGYRGNAELTGTAEATCTPDRLLFETDAVALAAAGDVQSPPVTALPGYGDTVWWVEQLTLWDGERERVIHTGICGLAAETTTIEAPAIRTESAGTVAAGQELYDTAFVSGSFPNRADVAFRVRFTAFARGADGRLTCTSGSEIRDLSDPVGVAVTGPGRYESRRVATRQGPVGLGGFVETLVMTVEGVEHVVAQGKCGARDENFDVQLPGAQPSAELPQTGQPVPPLLGGLAAVGAVLAGSALLTWRLLRRRRHSAFRECRDIADRTQS